MPREITERNLVVDAVRNLSLTAELFEEQNGKPKYAGDLEVIVHGRDYGNGKKVGPYVRLLEYERLSEHADRRLRHATREVNSVRKPD